jgi:hypothetical protein
MMSIKFFKQNKTNKMKNEKNRFTLASTDFEYVLKYSHITCIEIQIII